VSVATAVAVLMVRVSCAVKRLRKISVNL
jgi:hypothetical protein